LALTPHCLRGAEVGGGEEVMGEGGGGGGVGGVVVVVGARVVVCASGQQTPIYLPWIRQRCAMKEKKFANTGCRQ